MFFFLFLFSEKYILHKESFISDDLIPFVCQREICPNAGNAEATKVCYDHNVSISYSTDSPPPLYLCIECANEIHREHANLTFGDILHPMAQVSMICENKVSAIKNAPKFAFSLKFNQHCLHPNRTAAQLTNQLYQSVSLLNVPVTMVIIQFDIVCNAITIVTISVVVLITLFIKVYRQHGKWIQKCKPTWLKQ